MATTYKILGQSAPANTSNADLYTVPSSTQTIVSTVAIANTAASSALGRIFVVPSAGSASTANAIVYDYSFESNSTVTLTLGITLTAGDKIIVRSGTANALTFHAFGSEIS
jgi:hypothetical protein